MGDTVSRLGGLLARWRKSGVARAVAQWRLASLEVGLARAGAQGTRTAVALAGGRCGAALLTRLGRRRAGLRLRRALDAWWLAAHSAPLQLATASRALQLLFAADLRVVQRSLLRWRRASKAAAKAERRERRRAARERRGGRSRRREDLAAAAAAPREDRSPAGRNEAWAWGRSRRRAHVADICCLRSPCRA